MLFFAILLKHRQFFIDCFAHDPGRRKRHPKMMLEHRDPLGRVFVESGYGVILSEKRAYDAGGWFLLILIASKAWIGASYRSRR